MTTEQKMHLARVMNEKREAVREALIAYDDALNAAYVLTEDDETDERTHYTVSKTQVDSAKRVLWMD